MQYDEFLKQVRLRGGLHTNDEARSAIRAVFETLKRRIVHDTGDNVKAQLPHDIQPLWEGGFMEHIGAKVGGPERLDLTAFIGKVADKMETDDFTRVEMITRAVFTTMRQAITPGAQESIERELPEDLREFWLSCEPPEMPQESAAGKQQMKTTDVKMEPEPQRAETGGQPLETEDFKRTEPPIGAELHPMEATAGAQQTEFETIYFAEQGVYEMEAPVPTEMTGEPHPYEPTERKMEAEVRPPSEERMETVPPSVERKAEEGPGSETHYRLDPQLEHEIKSMLDESDEINADKINVFVQAGNVVLRGTVENEKQRETAGHIAAKALGVGDILNELSVEEETGNEGFLF